MKTVGYSFHYQSEDVSVKISPHFVLLAMDKDTEQPFPMLPYKSLSFSMLESKHDVYTLIDKSERNKWINKSHSSVRAQLQTEKSPKQSLENRGKNKISQNRGISAL